MTEDRWIRIGQIVGSFGLRGEMKIEPLTEFGERFEVGRQVRIGKQIYEIESSRWHKGRPMVRLTGIDDVEGAKSRQFLYLEARESERPELDDGEFLTEDLIGLPVFEGDEYLGDVTAVLAGAAHDVFQVGSNLFVPVVKQFVLSINPEDRIMVRLIPGMRPGDVDS